MCKKSLYINKTIRFNEILVLNYNVYHAVVTREWYIVNVTIVDAIHQLLINEINFSIT